MSQPTLGGQIPKLAVENGIARVTDTGDFFIVGDDTQVTHRCLLIRKTSGELIFGSDPGKSTPTPPGGEPPPPKGAGTRDAVAGFRITLPAGTYEWFVWGGVHSRYVRADGSVAYDVYEWGNYDLSHPERVATGTLTVGGTAPPPPPPPAPSPTVTLESATTKAVSALYELVEARRALGDTDAKIFNTLYYQVIRALNLPVGDGRRVKVKDAIKQALA